MTEDTTKRIKDPIIGYAMVRRAKHGHNEEDVARVWPLVRTPGAVEFGGHEELTLSEDDRIVGMIPAPAGMARPGARVREWDEDGRKHRRYEVPDREVYLGDKEVIIDE